jgi:NAD(P)-dependent dehydrogenase (short-subunit alcohol dehydrogenase family)
MSGYCASKGGVIQITKTAALEYAKHNIRVNCIAPGLIDTKMTRRRAEFDPEAFSAVLQSQAIKRIGKPEEVALAALYLASDDPSFVTVHCLVIDGGWTVA